MTKGSSFSNLASDDWDDSDVITMGPNKDVINIQGTRFRKFQNISQDHIYHYLLSQNNCRKIYVKSHWYVEIKNHSPCPMSCQDEFG